MVASGLGGNDGPATTCLRSPPSVHQVLSVFEDGQAGLHQRHPRAGSAHHPRWVACQGMSGIGGTGSPFFENKKWDKWDINSFQNMLSSRTGTSCPSWSQE